MKALSVKQPWANLIAQGKKTIETRSWPTDYRGELLIVSSRIPPIAPAGCAVAVVDLVDCRLMTADDEVAACCKVYRGAWAWMLTNVRRVKPWPIRGQLRIFDVELPELQQALVAEMKRHSATIHRAPLRRNLP